MGQRQGDAGPRGVRDYCASAAMPLAGAKRLRRSLAASGKTTAAGTGEEIGCRREHGCSEQAKRMLRGSSRVGKDGVRIFTPDATGGYGAFWVRDWSYMIEGCPEAFTREEIRDGYLFLAAAQRADGCMPDRVPRRRQGRLFARRRGEAVLPARLGGPVAVHGHPLPPILEAVRRLGAVPPHGRRLGEGACTSRRAIRPTAW